MNPARGEASTNDDPAGGRLFLRAAAALAALALVASATTSASAVGESDSGKAQSFWLHMDSSPISDAQIAAQAKKHAYVVLNAWEGALTGKFKKANPAIKVFVYKDLSSTRSYACRNGKDDAQIPTGVGYCAAQKTHPEWFLTSAAGKRFQYSGYAGHWQMDIGNIGYQKAWGDNVIANAKAGGFDGVLMDNALFTCDTYHQGTCPKAYPTDKAFQSAYKSMFANLRGRFAAAGLLTVANLANARLHPGTWDAYTENLDGGFDEWWLAFGEGDLLPEGADGWSAQAKQIASNEARGKITWVQPHLTPGDDRSFRYALASYFLVQNGTSAIAETVGRDDYGDPAPARPEYDWDLGDATGPYRTVGKNLLVRDFTCGTVAVNANPGASGGVRIPLTSLHRDERGQSVTSVTLKGTSGAILRRACSPATTTKPPTTTTTKPSVPGTTTSAPSATAPPSVATTTATRTTATPSPVITTTTSAAGTPSPIATTTTSTLVTAGTP